jgi:hypothetical protein
MSAVAVLVGVPGAGCAEDISPGLWLCWARDARLRLCWGARVSAVVVGVLGVGCTEHVAVGCGRAGQATLGCGWHRSVAVAGRCRRRRLGRDRKPAAVASGTQRSAVTGTQVSAVAVLVGVLGAGSAEDVSPGLWLCWAPDARLWVAMGARVSVVAVLLECVPGAGGRERRPGLRLRRADDARLWLRWAPGVGYGCVGRCPRWRLGREHKPGCGCAGHVTLGCGCAGQESGCWAGRCRRCRVRRDRDPRRWLGWVREVRLWGRRLAGVGGGAGCSGPGRGARLERWGAVGEEVDAPMDVNWWGSVL